MTLQSFYAQLQQWMPVETPLPILKKQWEAMNQKYKACHGQYTQIAQEHLAYILARMPSTHAACIKVIQESLSHHIPSTILDIGAGPGTVSWACLEQEALSRTQIVQMEVDPFYHELLHHVTSPMPCKPFVISSWEAIQTRQFDWAIASYVLCEINDDQKPHFIKQTWEACKELLILIQPGTPAGHHELMQARQHLLKQGAYILAPCLHQESCPCPTEEWCHFKARFERTKTQQYLKNGSRSFEDEKFSYLIASHTLRPNRVNLGRLTSSAYRHSSHLTYNVCTSYGAWERVTFSKKEKEKYKEAKKHQWGEVMPLKHDKVKTHEAFQ